MEQQGNEKDKEQSYNVLSTQWIMHQLMAQSCRVDRCNSISWAALIISVLALVVAFIF